VHETKGNECSVLADIALQFIPKKELMATAGLGHLLRSSAAAREALEVYEDDTSGFERKRSSPHGSAPRYGLPGAGCARLGGSAGGSRVPAG